MLYILECSCYSCIQVYCSFFIHYSTFQLKRRHIESQCMIEQPREDKKMLPLKIKHAVKSLYVNISVLPKFDKDSSIFLFSKTTKNFNAFKNRFDVSIILVVIKKFTNII